MRTNVRDCKECLMPAAECICDDDSPQVPGVRFLPPDLPEPE